MAIGGDGMSEAKEDVMELLILLRDSDLPVLRRQIQYYEARDPAFDVATAPLTTFGNSLEGLVREYDRWISQVDGASQVRMEIKDTIDCFAYDLPERYSEKLDYYS